MDFNQDTIPCPPPEGCTDRAVSDFEARLMGVPRDAGTKRPTTWQQTHERDRKFNARGCV